MPKVILQVMKQVSPPAAKPYRLFETYMTSDGFRSRICDGVWATEEEATARRAEIEAAAAEVQS